MRCSVSVAIELLLDELVFVGYLAMQKDQHYLRHSFCMNIAAIQRPLLISSNHQEIGFCFAVGKIC